MLTASTLLRQSCFLMRHISTGTAKPRVNQMPQGDVDDLGRQDEVGAR
jgi:hypothetical protein